MDGPSWIRAAPNAPYFIDEAGAPWTPIGQNDAIDWPELRGLFRRRDLPAVERHLRWLKASGVTCLRLMMEYAEGRGRYFENPIGHPVPDMVRLWDDLFALCEQVGLRILLTPFDTFWTWLKFTHHPYSQARGGPLDHPSRLLLCGETRAAIKARLEFAVRRWGGSGALFAWDLWNEIHPAQAQDSAHTFPEFIADLSQHVRTLEQALYGRTHPQTVSLFGPELWWRPEMPIAEPIFRHPDLDFCNLHIYREGTIDAPRDTVQPAMAMGRIVRDCLAEITDGRPFFDSEHGPIHTFKDKKKSLPRAFDDEYFRHLQWAHFASGGAGGGMRWPNRRPHVLTAGMREAQGALAGFTGLIDWTRFDRTNLNDEVRVSAKTFGVFACGSTDQAVVWLLRRGALDARGQVRRDAPPVTPEVRVPGLEDGAYRITAWDTAAGAPTGEQAAESAAGTLTFTPPPIATDRAFAIRRAS